MQNVLGTMQQFEQQVGRLDERARNQLQVRLELQADCYAGVWAFFAQKRNRLEPGDLEEGMRAAAAVGDDMIMKRTQGRVVPDAFTHGSAEQRVRWFRKGLASGNPQSCDTFSGAALTARPGGRSAPRHAAAASCAASTPARRARLPPDRVRHEGASWLRCRSCSRRISGS